MAIPASQIVQVNPRLLQPGGVDLEFNGLFLTRETSIPTDQLVLPFADPDGVGAYFGLESEEYRLASIYFLGYANSFIKPRALYFARRIDEAAPPFLRGGSLATDVAGIKAVAAGSLTLTLGADTATLSNLNFTTITAYSDAAGVIQTALRERDGDAWKTATVTYSSLFNAFTVTGGVAGGEQSVSYASGDVADLLQLTLAGGAVTSRGSDALTETGNMEAILRITRNWVCFSTVWRAEREEMIAYAEWSNSKGVSYLYALWDDDMKLLQPNNAATVGAALAELNVSAVCAEWKGPEYAAFLLGAAAAIDWNRRQGTITFAFKSQDGLAPNVDNGQDAVCLTAQGFNFMGNYATRNDEFIFHYPGQMYGRWRWIDTYLNAVWLNNALQVSIMNGFGQSPRVPYTESGYALIRSWLQDPVNRALNNGIIDPGVTLSESQKAQVNREAGADIAPSLTQNGYFIQIQDPAPAVRVTRDSPIVNLWYTYGGSVHKLTVASTAIV